MPHLGDKRVYSLECSGRVVIDRNCNLSTIGGHFDKNLEVDVGGSVVMTATTIDFRNTTIDFDGATLNNFTGDISGNISGTINVDVVNALELNAKQRITGNLEGNVLGGIIKGTVSGTFCGDVTTNNIALKDASYISIIGPTRFNGFVNLLNNNLNTTGIITSTGGFVGKLTGDSIGTHKGPVQTDNLSSLTPSAPISVTSNITMTNPTKFFNGNLCGSVFTDLIQPKSADGNITIAGNIEATKITADTFCGNLVGNFYGNLIISNVVGNFLGTFYGDVVGGNISGNVFAKEFTAESFSVTTFNTTEVNAANLCGNIITDKISSKTQSYVDIKDDLIVRGNVFVTEVGKTLNALNYVVYNSIKQNGSGPLNIVNGINSTGTNTSTISAKLVISSGGLSITSGGLTVSAGGVNVPTGTVTCPGGFVGPLNGDVTASDVTTTTLTPTGVKITVNGGLEITGDLCVDRILAEATSDIVVVDPLDVQNTLDVSGFATFTNGGSFTGSLSSNGFTSTNGATISGAGVTMNGGAVIMSGGTVTMSGGAVNITSGDVTVSAGNDLNFSTTGSVIRIGGTQVLKSQEPAIASIGVTGGTDLAPGPIVIQDVDSLPGAPTFAQAAFVDDVRDGFETVMAQIDRILAALRNHGIIDT